MSDPRKRQEIKGLLLHFARRKASDENNIDDSEYNSMLDDVNEHDVADIVPAVLDAYVESDYMASIVITCIIKDLKRCPTLPHETILRMDTLKNARDGQDMLCKLALLYSTYFYSGYPHLVSLDELIVKYKIDPERVMAFIRAQTSISNLEGGDEDQDDVGDETGADDGFSTIPRVVTREVQDRIDEIQPFSKSTPYSRINGAFESPIPVKIRMAPIVQVLNGIKERILDKQKGMSGVGLSDEPFVLPLGPFADDVIHPVGKKIARQVEQSMERGCYTGQLAKLVELEKLEPGNPRVYLEKSLLIRDLMGDREEPGFHLCLVEILKAMKTPASNLNIEYFYELAMNLQMLGYFHSSYLISLILLQINPADFNSLISAAFNAYQLLKPFKHFLETAVIVDPGRLLNFLDEFWISSRFRPHDSFQRLGIADAMVDKIEQDVGTKQLVPLDSDPEVNDSLVAIRGMIDSLDDILFKQLQKGVTQAIKDSLIFPDTDRRKKKRNTRASKNATVDHTCKSEENGEDDAVNQWFDGMLPKWQKSQLYEQLPQASWKVREDIPRMAARLYHDAHGALPREWTWQNLEHVLIQDFPQKVSAPRYYFKSIGVVLRKFCTFLQESQDIDGFRGFPEKIKQISSRIYERAIEVGPWDRTKEYSF